jgi:hypothetical protein
MFIFHLLVEMLGGLFTLYAWRRYRDKYFLWLSLIYLAALILLLWNSGIVPFLQPRPTASLLNPLTNLAFDVAVLALIIVLTIKRLKHSDK